MKCSRCQHDNEAGAKFCEECALPMAPTCANCGRQLSATAKFCPDCAHPTGLAPTTASTERFGSPQSYTPKHLAEKILTSKSALEGERKQVTVLFVDIVDSTQLAQRLGPEGMHEVLDRALRLMAEAVHRYDGTVNQFLGDGLMALFGAPVALEDHALRAVQTALAIQETIGGLAQDLRRERDVDIRVRIGLNTGLVVVGKIGDDLRMDYTAIGDTTNLAARVMALAEAGTILAAGPTHRLVEGQARSEALGPVSVKGISEPVSMHRITGRRRRSRLEISAERGLAQLVGRDRELGVLRDALARAVEGRGQVVGIVGEPGVGKSRLVYEFRQSLADDRVTWLAGHCLAYGQSTPYLPIVEILRSNFQVEEGDNLLQIDEKLRGGLRQLDPALEEILPHLRELVLSQPDEALKTLDPKTRRQKAFEAIRALTVAGSQRAPLVLVIEDLHWIDRTSEDYLAFLVESLAGLRAVIITTHRPGYAVRWADKTYCTQVALDVLGEPETAAIVRALFDTDDVPAELVRLVHEKAEGNPLFVEEIARSLVERGVAVRRNGGMVWAREVPVDFPETAQDIIRARIDRLDEPVKRTAQTAAVIGRQFGMRLLGAVADTRALIQEVLDVLRHAELIHETRVFPELEYIFKHAIIQDVAYQSILERRRKELHRAIGQAIEELYADRLTEHYEVLAHHYARSDDRAKAVEYLTKAGDKAAAVYANREAFELYGQALTLVPEGDVRQRAVISHKAGLIAFAAGELDRGLPHAQASLKLFEALGDKVNIVRTHRDLAGLYGSGAWDGAREDRALSHIEAAAALVKDDPDDVEKGLTYQRGAHLYLHRGEPATARGWAERAAEVFARLNVPMGTAFGTAVAYLGLIDEGVGYNQQNWDTVSKGRNPMIMAILGHELTLTLALARDPRRSVEWGERIYATLTETMKNPAPFFEANILRPLTFAHVLCGEQTKAAALSERVERIHTRTLLGCVWEDGMCIGLRHFRDGDWNRARAALEEALRELGARNQVGAISGCSFALGNLEMALGRYREAEDLLQRSLAICRNGGNILFQLWVLPSLAELYVETGRLNEARRCVEDAAALMASDRNWYGLPGGVDLARALVAASERKWKEAEQEFENAVAINRRYELPFDEAKALATWGRMSLLRAASGDRERARERLGAALETFQRVGAVREVEKVRAALEPLRA
jgi:class 3 adenylate cyclase/tetratricopeptide (TPR) repeat protein